MVDEKLSLSDSMNKSQGNKGQTTFQRERERKNIWNRERGKKTTKKAWRNRKAVQGEVGKSSQLQP
jgi:hypothetical protein